MQERGSPCPRRLGRKSSRGKRQQHVHHTAGERVGPFYWQSNLSKVVWLKSSRVQDTPVPGRGEAGASREGWDLAPVSGRRAWRPPVLCCVTAQTSKSQPTCRYRGDLWMAVSPLHTPSHDSEAALIKRGGGCIISCNPYWSQRVKFQWRLKRSLVFPFLCFPLFLCIDPWGRLFYLSLLFSGTLHSDGFILPFLLCFSLLFTAICKPSSDSHFTFLHFFFLGMVLIPVSCTISPPSMVHQALDQI